MRVSGSIHITADVEGEKVFITFNKSATKPNKPTGTGETDGWSAANEDGAIWMSVKNATDINEGEWSEPIRVKGEQGERGYQGPIPYPAGAWNSSTTYTRTDLKVPYVIFNGLYYYLRPVASIQGGNDPQTDYAANGSNATWIKIEDLRWLFVEILLAQWAKLGSAIFDNDKLISQYGMLNGSSSNSYTSSGFIPNLMLNFLDGSGHLARKNIEWNGEGDLSIRGGFASPFESFTSSPDDKYSNNYFIQGTAGWTTYFSVPFTTDQNGRTLRIFVKNGGGRSDAPTGKYFYQNGRSGTVLYVEAGTIVEMLGYGTSSNFLGWIILNRRYVEDYGYNYGAPSNIIAAGKVVGSSSGASVRYRAFDGSGITVSRQGIGIYNVYFSTMRFNTKDDYYVMLTGVTTDTTNDRMKATVASQTTAYFTVHVSDDDTGNDGSFYFQVFSALDFVY